MKTKLADNNRACKVGNFNDNGGTQYVTGAFGVTELCIDALNEILYTKQIPHFGHKGDSTEVDRCIA